MYEKRIADIPEYSDVRNYYYITSEGQIISLKNNIPHIMAFRLSGVGYYYAHLATTKKGKQLQELIHRLVAKAFIPIENPCKTIVHHIDNNKLNNHYENLTWVTYEENIKYSIADRLFINGQISIFDTRPVKPVKKFVFITNKKILQKQLSIADIC